MELSELREEVIRHVRSHANDYREAGAWLDQHYGDRSERVLEADLEGSSVTRRLALAFWDLLDAAEPSERLVQRSPLLAPEVWPDQETSRRILLVQWLISDPSTNSFETQLTALQDWSHGELSHELMHLGADAVIQDRKRWENAVLEAWKQVGPQEIGANLSSFTLTNEDIRAVWGQDPRTVKSQNPGLFDPSGRVRIDRVDPLTRRRIEERLDENSVTTRVPSRAGNKSSAQ